MIITDNELNSLKELLREMWQMVITQFEQTEEAFFSQDEQLAYEVISRERTVDLFDLKIDSDCERYMALYHPVAVDLRLLLSILKICKTLERIADFAEGLSRITIKYSNEQLNSKLIEALKLKELFRLVRSMLEDSYKAMQEEDSRIAGKILLIDNKVDKLYRDSFEVLAKQLKEENELIALGLDLLLMIRKLERVGDQCENIAEEIVFYVDAKVLRHSSQTASLDTEN